MFMHGSVLSWFMIVFHHDFVLTCLWYNSIHIHSDHVGIHVRHKRLVLSQSRSLVLIANGSPLYVNMLIIENLVQILSCWYSAELSCYLLIINRLVWAITNIHDSAMVHGIINVFTFFPCKILQYSCVMHVYQLYRYTDQLFLHGMIFLLPNIFTIFQCGDFLTA